MNALQTLTAAGKTYSYYSLASLGVSIDAMPFSIRILLESVLRNCDSSQITEQDVKNLAAYKAEDNSPSFEIPFKPARVILQDFTGVPAVVDLAAMRSAMQRLGGDPNKINPLIPVDLVIDHSVQTDFYGTADCLQKNVNLEFKRNAERYALLNWAQKSLSNFRVIPPSVGIIHQVNLEYLAGVISVAACGTGDILYPDSVLGTDSHTVMINGLGVLGWGVGGIEAEAVMLGQPYYMLAPQVVGFELTGKLNEGVTATDLVLTITEILRKEKVVGKFVEYFGTGASSMPLADRAVVANMAPEYGATMGYFPVDDNTLQYLRETGRDEEHVQIVEAYCKANNLFRAEGCRQPSYTKVLSFDLSTVEPCIAGPKRPQDRIILKNLETENKENFRERLIQKFDRLAAPLENVPYSEENILRLFGKERSVQTPIGKVKIGENQFTKLHAKERENLLGVMKQTLSEPIVIAKEQRESGDYLLFIKSFIKDNNEEFICVMSVVVEIDNVFVSISTYQRKNSQIFQKIGDPAAIVWEVPTTARSTSCGYSVNSPSPPHKSQEDDTARPSLSSNFPKSQEEKLRDRSVVIASITSCTNTSNPKLMLAAGLLAKKAIEKGLTVPSFVKTSLAPGSRVVADYLTKSGLLKPLEQLGFNIAGFGCMTCIGNSGTLKPEVEKEITEKNLTVAAVLSGNRNFEGRINPFVKENYLASPPLVAAFAIAGRMDINLTTEPLGKDKDGNSVFLRDIFPSNEEVDEVAKIAVDAAVYRSSYQNVFTSNEKWNAVESKPSLTFDWDKDSTYIQEPPFLETQEQDAIVSRRSLRVLALLGDSVTTDHISPAGSIKKDSPAGKYLIDKDVSPSDFNSYGSRRGNDRVMTRGTFANIRIKNLLLQQNAAEWEGPSIEGGFTKHFPSGEILPIYDAAMRYQKEGTPLIIIAGSEYGTGSSRDWAAKGTALLGVKAVIAQSFERIHRGNLVGMGVLPLEFANGATCQSLQLTGEEEFTIPSLSPDFNLTDLLTIKAARPVMINGREMFAETEFQVKVRIDTPVELQYYINGGILPTVLKSFIGDYRRT